MDLKNLREFLRPLIGELKGRCSGMTMPSFCESIGLPFPPDASSKRERLEAAFDLVSDADVPGCADKLIAKGLVSVDERNHLQELLWSEVTWPQIPKRLRRELARAIDSVGLYEDARRFDALLNSLFIISGDIASEFFGGPETSGLRFEIKQHVHRNSDWDANKLFDEIGALDCSDRRFALLLEGLAGGDVRLEVGKQQSFVERLNPVLKTAGLEFRETGIDGGYPVFEVLSLHTSRGRPKNLIFASQEKPDLRFIDTMDNEIEIVSNADKVLVYDRPIGADGLRWNDLQLWWAQTNAIADETEAKTSLYQRLLACLPDSSPPQNRLFRAYFKAFKQAIPGLPVLLPEVWLHWDPRTVRERGVRALLSHRMDFLLLVPGGVRVVIEVDGQQHYASNDRADPHRYAKMAAADRELKLARYEVYRFGAVELLSDTIISDTRAFFAALFARYQLL